jgi:2-polyprenyl-3-methyl-5-hydroxy-6-metoxy-1,4-benzoquinol methylase
MNSSQSEPDKFEKVSNAIPTRRVSQCYLCGSEGNMLHQNIRDHVFGAPGLWSFRKCRNEKCGLIWIDPSPLPSHIGKLYENYYTHQQKGNDAHSPFHRRLLKNIHSIVRDCYVARRYGYREIAPRLLSPLGFLLYFFPLRRALLDFETMQLSYREEGRLLEIGCGDGLFLSRMQQLGWKVSGVDPDPSALMFQRGLLDADLRCGNLNQVKFAADSFDVIVMSHVIEHIDDPVALLDECRRLLRPEGTVIIATPNSKSWGHRIFRENWRGLEPPRHFMIFSSDNLAECVRRAGIEPVSVRTVSRWARNIFLASQQIRNSGARGQVRLIDRVAAYWFQIFQQGAKQFSRTVGEEIFFVGKKRDNNCGY